MGYFQVEMDPKDREKTAFVVQNGLYHLKVMAMAYATRQRRFNGKLKSICKSKLNTVYCLFR